MAQGVASRARRSGTETALDPPKNNVRINPDRRSGMGIFSVHNGHLRTPKLFQPSVQHTSQLDAVPISLLLIFGAIHANLDSPGLLSTYHSQRLD